MRLLLYRRPALPDCSNRDCSKPPSRARFKSAALAARPDLGSKVMAPRARAMVRTVTVLMGLTDFGVAWWAPKGGGVLPRSVLRAFCENWSAPLWDFGPLAASAHRLSTMSWLEERVFAEGRGRTLHEPMKLYERCDRSDRSKSCEGLYVTDALNHFSVAIQTRYRPRSLRQFERPKTSRLHP